MKRYKLLKDLPTFKAGEEFYINSVGDLVRDKDDVFAYTAETLIKFSSILEDWFEEIKENDNARRRGKIGEEYWWFDITYGEALKDVEDMSVIDNNRYKVGNYFKTEQGADDYGRYLKALQIIKDDAKGFKPDWKNDEEVKYCGRFNWNKNAFLYNTCYVIQFQGAVYFGSREDIEESFKKHEKEWLIVLGVEK